MNGFEININETDFRAKPQGEQIWKRGINVTLRQKQSKFAHLIGMLILWTYEQGYELTFGDAWAKTGHKQNSFHYSRLAIDLNLFKDGRYLTSTESHRPLGEYWMSLDPNCTWGGNFQDGNHYSFGEK